MRTRSVAAPWLRLSSGRHLVSPMGGEVGLVSEPGHGSTVWLAMPQTPDSHGSPTGTTAGPADIVTSWGA